MSDDDERSPSTLALPTKVEEDFVSPLTAVRGSLEILRDFPNLAADERRRFVEMALQGCARLERAVQDLAHTVYAAGQRPRAAAPDSAETRDHEARTRLHDDLDIVEIDLAGVVFNNSHTVNAFYDRIEALVRATGKRWYFLVNYGGCSVWPEAWVAFAHRGKNLNVGFSLGTVRYDDRPGSRAGGSGDPDPDFVATRDAALARIEALKAASA